MTYVPSSVDTVLADLDPVMANLKARPDFDSAMAADLTMLGDFRQKLLLFKSNPSSASATNDVRAGLNDNVLPFTNSQIAANTKMINMGQLNTQRTISPTTAEANNKALEALQQSGQQLLADLGGPLFEINLEPPAPLNPAPDQKSSPPVYNPSVVRSGTS